MNQSLRFLFMTAVLTPLWAVNYNPYDFCSVIKHCLVLESRGCEDKHYKKNEDIDYDLEFCGEVNEAYKLLGTHLTTSSRKTLTLLGKQYRMVYNVKGELLVSENQMQYLLGNIPFAAHLINAYNESEYSAEYLTPSKKVFKGTNGRSLKGRFRWAHKRPKENLMMAYGDGYAKVLMWNLKGTAIVYINFTPLSPNKVEFTVKCIAFPSGAMLNGIMSMGMFKSMVQKKINQIIDDVVKAAQEYASGNTKPITKIKYLKTLEGERWLREWNQILQADKNPVNSTAPAKQEALGQSLDPPTALTE